jgi:tetratricopeptide (TPR) repeat protein
VEAEVELRVNDHRSFMQLNEIKRARDKGDLDIALAACNELLEKDAASIDALRIRASVWFLKDRQTEALQDYQLVIESGLTNAGDFFLGADVAIQLEKYDLACEWLERVVEIGLKSGNHGFDSSAYFLTAYSKMQSGRYEEALSYLEKAEAVNVNIALPIPGETGVASAQHLRAEINRRKQD